MKILTCIGTRPEIIRLSRIISKLDKVCEHILVHTGQNYDYKLNEIFFKELMIRKPDYFMKAKGSFGKQIGIILTKTEQILNKIKPDKMLILGDTNTDLSAYVAERMGIPVFHMEAGNRCWDKEVPEEINRRMIDHISTYNFPYTHKSKENLIREGINPQTIYISGNPIYEVMSYYEEEINKYRLFTKNKEYNLVTLHRAENVDNPEKFKKILTGLNVIAEKNLLIISIHPRTREKLATIGIKLNKNIELCEPFGFFEFIKLEQNAKCILTDSGTVQEEACILHIPCVVMRKTTERSETIECGATILTGIESEDIIQGEQHASLMDTKWKIPEEYLFPNVSDKIINYLISKENIGRI